MIGGVAVAVVVVIWVLLRVRDVVGLGEVLSIEDELGTYGLGGIKEGGGGRDGLSPLADSDSSAGSLIRRGAFGEPKRVTLLLLSLELRERLGVDWATCIERSSCCACSEITSLLAEGGWPGGIGGGRLGLVAGTDIPRSTSL